MAVGRKPATRVGKEAAQMTAGRRTDIWITCKAGGRLVRRKICDVAETMPEWMCREFAIAAASELKVSDND